MARPKHKSGLAPPTPGLELGPTRSRARTNASAPELEPTPQPITLSRPSQSRPSQSRPSQAPPPPNSAAPASWLDLVAGVDRKATIIAILVALVAGLAWALAAPAFDLWPLAWVAAAPLCWIVDRAASPRRARRLAWLAGTVTSIAGFHWIVGLLVRHSNLPMAVAIVALLLLSAYHGLVFWLFAASVRAIRDFTRARGAPLPMALLAPLAMVTFETIVPTIFSYNLAVTQAWQTPVIQIAELTGPTGVTALLFVAGGALFDVFSATSRRRRWLPAAAAAGLVAAALGFGWLRMAQIDDRRARAPKLSVGLVQGNIAFDGPAPRAGDYAPSILAGLQRASADLEARGAELIVWSESGYPYLMPRYPLPQIANASLRRDPATLEDHPCVGEERDPTRSCWNAVDPIFTVPLVMGATTYRVPFDVADYPYNSALMVDGDRIVARFDKMSLLLFSEHIPFIDTFPSLADILPRGSGHFARGDSVVTFPLTIAGTSYRLAPLICLEDTLASFARELAAHRPHLLVNVTNDTWFGDTSEPWQHLALAVFRTVELRTEMVRAVNSGVSAFVDANGRVSATSYVVDPALEPTAMSGLLGEVALIEGGDTIYARVGNLFAYACVLATLLLWLAGPVARRRRRRSLR